MCARASSPMNLNNISLGFVLFTVICSFQLAFGISSLEETYTTFLHLMKRQFNVPVQLGTTMQKSTSVPFWHNCHHSSLRGDKLCNDGKQTVKKLSLAGIVKNAFKHSKGSGVRKLYHQFKTSCTGVGERDVRSMLGKSHLHQHLNMRFENKAVLKPVCACSIQIQILIQIQIQIQINLVDMGRRSTKDNGKVYKYVLSVLDAFSHCHWLVAMEEKKSSPITLALLNIYQEHRPPKGAVRVLCVKRDIIIIKGPYHSQSQGKVERAQRSLRKTIVYNLLLISNSGVKWAKAVEQVYLSM